MFEHPYHLSLHPHVAIKHQHGEVILSYQKLNLVFDATIIPLDKLFFLLKSPGGTIDFIIKTFATSIAKTAIYYVTQQLSTHGLLCFTLLAANSKPIIMLEPMTTRLEFSDDSRELSTNNLVLSRFSYIRKKDEVLILESPLGNSILYLNDPRSMLLIHLLTTPCSLNDLANSAAFFTKQELLASLNLFKIAKALTNADENNKHLMQWDFHDLLFHSRTRGGRHHYPSGKTFRFRGKTEPSLALKEGTTNKIINLPRPQNLLNDEPLQTILEKRRSLRNYSEKSITLVQLSEFLYRSVRVRESSEPKENSPYQTTQRLYPSAGACYELEIYICLQRSATLTAGLYHYHPQQHALQLITADKSALQELNAEANRAIGKNDLLDILLIITARFGRVNWQYEAIAYLLILKNVGVLYQTFYLVATAMGLAPCALGSGDADLFARVAGLDYAEETSVGEFLLGIEDK